MVWHARCFHTSTCLPPICHVFAVRPGYRLAVCLGFLSLAHIITWPTYRRAQNKAPPNSLITALSAYTLAVTSTQHASDLFQYASAFSYRFLPSMGALLSVVNLLDTGCLSKL